MADAEEGVGCRSAFLTGIALLAAALVVGGVGLAMTLSVTCVGGCQRMGLALFYAAAPTSALLGVLFGGIPIAWPLDAGIWLMLGVGLAKWRARRPRWQLVLAVGLLALLYGLFLSQFVEVDRLPA